MSDATDTDTPGTLLPLFPLSNVVLYPKVQTPLHLFEPRYRALGRDVLQGERRIGMVTVRPDYLNEMPGDPPIFPIGCCGVIGESQKLPDGRYNVVLHGEYRFRVVEEAARPSDRLYRVARVIALRDDYPDGTHTQVSALRRAIIEDVGAILKHVQPERAASFRAELFEGVVDEVLVNTLSNTLALPAQEKQMLLEADTIPERFTRLAEILSFRRAEFEAVGGSGPSSLH